MALNNKQVAEALKDQGHSVKTYHRPDGGFRIIEIDGVKFSKASSKGNSYARSILRNYSVASKINPLDLDVSSKRLDQLQKARVRAVRSRKTTFEKAGEGFSEINKLEKLIDKIVKEGRYNKSDFTDLDYLRSTISKALEKDTKEKSMKSRKNLNLEIKNIKAYRIKLNKERKPITNAAENKAEFLGILKTMGFEREYAIAKNKPLSYYFLNFKTLNDLEKAYKGGSAEDLRELVQENDELKRLVN